MRERRTVPSSRFAPLLIGLVALTTACFGGSDEIAVPGADRPTTTTTVDSTTTTAAPVVIDPPTTESPDSTPPTVATAPPSTAAPVVTEPPPPTPPPTVEDPFLRLGDEGDEVALMQLKLQSLGYLEPGYAAGVFDRPTADALIDFQAQYGLVVDGVFGPETDRSLTAAAESINPEA